MLCKFIFLDANLDSYSSTSQASEVDHGVYGVDEQYVIEGCSCEQYVIEGCSRVTHEM